MNQSPDPNLTAQTPDSSIPPDSLGAGLAAAFGQATEAPRSSFGGGLKPVVLPDAAGESSHIVKTQSDALPKAAQAGDRYQLSGEIARGGMGAVLRGRDVDLGRDLAIKVLLEKHAQRPEIARRFLEEAQIGGQLQHPGVVPVYDIGRFGERPFFTMKLVKGKTLAEVLAERKDITSDRPRLLGIALQVSQTLAYAHAKGVIHRDLKPANIMVGSFGEVQVMDWGLAKVLASGGVADEEKASRLHQEAKDETNIKTARSAGSNGSFGTDTEAGSLLGTPAYMPPEQANGDVALMDRRADVFGLGAILCEILTGKPPYVGRSQEEVRRKAANGDLADAYSRLAESGADKELLTLTRLCLSPEPIDRPKDAQAVAESLSGYLDGVQERLRTAERERAVAVVREAEQRKKGRVQLALAGTIALLLLGSGAFAFWQAELAQAGRERNARNGEAVAALLGQAEEGLKAGDAAKAAVVLEAAKKRSAEGGAEKDANRLKGLDADLALLRQLDAVDQFRWTVEENKFPDPVIVATRTREALTRFGADPDGMSVDEVAAQVSGSVVRERIISALDRLLRYQKTANVRALLQKVDGNPYRVAVRDAIFANDRTKMSDLAIQNEALEQPPEFTAFLGESSAIPLERKRQLLQAAVSQRPGNLGLLMILAQTYRENGAVDEQLRWYQAAVASAPANLAAHLNLGEVLRVKKDLAGAEAIYREAIRLDSKSAMAHNSLGIVLKDKPDLAGAEAAFREAIRLDPTETVFQNNLGNLLRGMGDLAGAERAYREALRLDNKYALSHGGLGTVLKNKKDLESAEAAYRESIRLDPKNANAHYKLGLLLSDKKDPASAEASFREAIQLDPKFASAHSDLGKALRVRKDLVGAEAACREAIRLDPKVANAHNNLGVVLSDKQDPAGAEAAFREAIRLNPKFAMAHSNLGIILKAKSDLAGAENAHREAIRLDPKASVLHSNLGVLLQAKKNFASAEAAFREAIRLDANDPQTHYLLGELLLDKPDLAGAETAYREAIRLDNKHAKAHDGLGIVLQAKGDLVGAEAACREAIRLDPIDTISRINFGLLLQAKKDLAGAEAEYREVLRLDNKRVEAHNNLGNVLRDKGDLPGAEAALREAIRLDPKSANTHFNLGHVLLAKGDLAGTETAYREAIRLNNRLVNAHYRLGHVLQLQGHYSEAKLQSEHTLTMLPENHPTRQVVSKQLQECVRMLTLESRLPGLLRGQDKITTAQEGLDISKLCQHKRLYVAGAHFSAEAFAADPNLLSNPQSPHRYNAACFAALAAAGKGEDATKLDAAAKAKLRGQALDWLKAELAAWAKLLDSGPPQARLTIPKTLGHWQKDLDLSSIRDAATMAKLPAAEQKAFAQLWTDVATLLKKAETPRATEDKK